MLVLIAVVSLAACTKDANEPRPGLPQQEGRTAIPQTQTGKLAVTIVPEAPTVMDNLQALYSGTGTAAYQWRKDGHPLEGENAPQLSKTLLSKGSSFSVTVTAGGEEGEAGVVIGNSPPTVISVPFSPEQIYAGVDITVAPVGFDPDGDNVRFSYHWTINDKEIPGDGPVLNGSLFKRGDKIKLSVVPSDLDGDGKPLVSQMTVPNGPPKITSNPPALHGSVYTYQVIAEDPDADPLVYSLASAPQGMSIDSRTGLLTWTIDQGSAGVHTIEIAAQDPGGRRTTQKFTLSVELTAGGTNENK